VPVFVNAIFACFDCGCRFISYVHVYCHLSSLQADTSRRHSYSVTGSGIELCTLQYRAPELLFGDLGFGYNIDSWSVGIMMAELSGYFFTGKEATVKHAAEAIVKQLGTPGEPCILSWPTFKSTQMHTKQPWPAAVHLNLGRDGVKLLDRFLCMDPCTRTLHS
jgi:serine/threonine protein kinase